MKTFPFIRVLIKFYWLLLLIAIGLLAAAFSNTFIVEKAEKTSTLNKTVATDVATISPELLANITVGKKLFRTNCATCHNKNMKSDMTGPALGGVRERWSDYPESDLTAWIKNSAELIEAEHPKAIEVYAKWDKVTMTAFNNMTDEEVRAILDYIDSVQ